METGSFSEIGNNGTHYKIIDTNITNIIGVYLVGSGGDHYNASGKRWEYISNNRIQITWQDNCSNINFECNWIIYGTNS